MRDLKTYDDSFNDKQLEFIFLDLKEKWLTNYSFCSNPNDLYGNEYYKGIISLGEDIIPILIRDIDSRNGDWIHALHKITGENPIKEGNAGYMDKMIVDWKNWYNENY